MWFLESIYKSFYDHKWLSAQKHKTGKAFGYFFLFVLLASVLTFAPLTVKFSKLLNQGQDILQNNVPDFTAEIKDNNLMVTGLEQPFVQETSYEGEKVIVVVDTVSSTTVPSIKDYRKSSDNYVLLVTKDQFAFYDAGEKKTEIYEFSDIGEDFSFTKNNIVDFINKFGGSIRYLLIFLFLFFAYLTVAVGKLIYIIFWSLLLFLLASIVKNGWKYQEIFIISLFAITLPTLVDAILFNLDLSFGFVYTVIYLVIVLSVMFFTGDRVAEQPEQIASKPEEEKPQINK